MAHLVLEGASPQRILLLTFTRRAAAEMTRRARRILGEVAPEVRLPWSGTFHAIANRLLRPAVTLPVEIYSDQRIREFDAAEADLDKLLRRKKKPAR